MVRVVVTIRHRNLRNRKKRPNRNKPSISARLSADMLVIGSIADAENLLPVISSDTASTAIIDQVYGALVKVGRNMDIVPDLAESWEFSDKGRTITFHLHKGVKWHDGEPFTANDCLFTYQVMIDPKTPTAYAEQFKQIEKAEVIDDYTFRVTYKKVFARALITWGMNIVPKHLLEGKDVSTSDLIKNPVGTGPYIFESWETGQKIELRANPDYFGGRPHIERIVTRVIPDLSTMFLELKNGSLDWYGPDARPVRAVVERPGVQKILQSIHLPGQ